MAEVRREWLERDYYKDLELSQAATDEEISAAYKKLVRKLHPDRNPGNERAEERFKEVSNAYKVIGNSSTRKQYDQARQAGFFSGGRGGHSGSHGGNPGQHSGSYQQHIQFDAEDLLSNLFGRSGGFSSGMNVPLSGTDFETNARITFDESMQGVVKNVSGFSGKNTNVKLPAGVQDRERVKVPNKGSPGSGGGPSGDLYVRVSVEKHEVYERKGNNLIINFPVSFSEATLGGTVKIPTYEGNLVEIKIPAGTASGTKFKIKGRGVPMGKSKKGDLLVKVEVHVPKKLSSEQKKSVKQMGELFGDIRP